MHHDCYCHTFENRSSFPPNPPTGFKLVVVVLMLVLMLVLVLGPVLLAQPPNSSSAATFGAVVKPPDPPGTRLCDANDPRPVALLLLLPVGAATVVVLPQPKSLDDAAGLVLDKPGLLVSDEFQALESHTSDAAHAALVDIGGGATAAVALLVCVAVLGVDAERLNSDEVAGFGGAVVAGAAGCGAGDERSNKSPKADGCAGLLVGGRLDDVKLPKFPKLLLPLFDIVCR